MNELQNQPSNQSNIPILKKRARVSLFEVVLISILFIIICYFCFNWLMGVFIHHRAEVQVPNLKGKSLEFAVDRLSSLQLALIKEEDEFNQSLPEGSVLRQTPIPGTLVREGKAIRVVLSKGGEMVFVPDLIDKPLRLAEIDLRQSTLALGEVSERYSLKTEKGHVLEQDPGSGMVVDRNTLIHLAISSGEPYGDIILMPDFLGKSIDEAKEWAARNDCAIKNIISDPFSAVFAGEIIRQIPQPDTIIDKSLHIQFVVGVSTDIASSNRVWHYALPQGSGRRKVMVKLVDSSVEHLIFKGTKSPGTKLDIPYHYREGARIHVYLDGILVEDREIP